MKQLSVSALLLLLCTFHSTRSAQYKTSDWEQTLHNINDGIQKLRNYQSRYKYSKYIKLPLDLKVGSDGLCQFKCPDPRYEPFPRPRYKPKQPNGCSAPVFGYYFDIRIPSMTECCNQHDRCYDTCARDKHDCDHQFQTCLNSLCRNVQLTQGLDQIVQVCESAVSLLFKAIVPVGCKPYLDSQEAACICPFVQKAEL